MKRTLAIILALVMCSALLFTGCSDKLDSSVVATIGGVEISQADYNLVYKSMYDQASQQYLQVYGEGWYNAEIDDKGTTVGKMLKDNTIENLKQLIAIEKIAEEKGVKVTDSEISEYVRGMKEQLGGEQVYKKYIEDYCVTEKAMETYCKRMLLSNKLYEKIASEQKVEEVSDEEAGAEYLNNYMKVQHVLIESTFENADENGDDLEALAKANEVIAKLDGGAEFDTLIEEYNTDPGMEPGKFYTFTTGEMVQEFEEASMNLQVGEYTTEPVRTSYGYHIIKKYELKAEGEEYEAFKQQLSQTKVQEQLSEVMTDLVDKKVKSLKVEVKDKVLNEYLDAWLKELGVNINAPKTPYTATETPDVTVEESEVLADEAPADEAPADEIPTE